METQTYKVEEEKPDSTALNFLRNTYKLNHISGGKNGLNDHRGMHQLCSM
jgi:hypothetical protein